MIYLQVGQIGYEGQSNGDLGFSHKTGFKNYSKQSLLSCLQLEAEDCGDGAVAAPADDDDAHLEGPRGTQPQDGQARAEFESEKRLGQERRARIMAQFTQSRARGGVQL